MSVEPSRDNIPDEVIWLNVLCFCDFAAVHRWRSLSKKQPSFSSISLHYFQVLCLASVFKPLNVYYLLASYCSAYHQSGQAWFQRSQLLIRVPCGTCRGTLLLEVLAGTPPILFHVLLWDYDSNYFQSCCAADVSLHWTHSSNEHVGTGDIHGSCKFCSRAVAFSLWWSELVSVCWTFYGLCLSYYDVRSSHFPSSLKSPYLCLFTAFALWCFCMNPFLHHCLCSVVFFEWVEFRSDRKEKMASCATKVYPMNMFRCVRNNHNSPALSLVPLTLCLLELSITLLANYFYIGLVLVVSVLLLQGFFCKSQAELEDLFSRLKKVRPFLVVVQTNSFQLLVNGCFDQHILGRLQLTA